jgi:peptidoglycan hydrolase-like protein with peptidoglycan-binding domain
VEYLQEQLNYQLRPSPGLTVDGNFGPATLKAVFAYQKQEGIQQDGVVGFQTWAQLRHTGAKPPSTDKRAPHSFLDTGAKARWCVEDEVAHYQAPPSDTLLLGANSVGTAPLEGGKVTVRITRPGKTDTVIARVGPPDTREKTETGQGALHWVTVPSFMKTYPSEPPGAALQDYFIEAYFDASEGGDFWKGKIVQD